MMDAISSYRIPESWETVRLGSLVESEKGKKPKRCASERSSSYSLPYINIRAFEEGVIESWADGEGCRMCHESDLLLVWDGARSGLVGKGMSGALGSTLARINFPLIENQYAFYFLQSKYDQINSRTKGSGTPHVDPDLLWNYEFPVPPFNEQRRIVARIKELFSELDKGIESLRKAREQLKLYRQAVLKHAFEGKLTAQWREENKDKLESPEQLLEDIKREQEARYDKQLQTWKALIKDWEDSGRKGKKPRKPKSFKPVSELAGEDTGNSERLPSSWLWLLAESAGIIQLGRQRSPRNRSKDYPTKYIRAANITENGLNLDDVLDMDFDPHEFSAYRLEKDDLLLSEGSGSASQVGKPAIWEDQILNCCFQNTVIRHQPYCCDHSPYLLWLYRFYYISGTFAQVAGGVGIHHLSAYKFARLPLPLCPILEQTEIVRQLEERFTAMQENEKEIDFAIEKAQSLRQSILQKAFSGQLVAQDPADEPASMLLERIKAETLAQSSGTERRNKRRRAKAPA
ncbi:MAG: restriction endonuclease subunit S [Gammaproteobacteria bacterium]|nr:restriction endonuclease subunit S [Gammaproteobacteria bacterium]